MLLYMILIEIVMTYQTTFTISQEQKKTIDAFFILEVGLTIY